MKRLCAPPYRSMRLCYVLRVTRLATYVYPLSRTPSLETKLHINLELEMKKKMSLSVTYCSTKNAKKSEECLVIKRFLYQVVVRINRKSVQISAGNIVSEVSIYQNSIEASTYCVGRVSFALHPLPSTPVLLFIMHALDERFDVFIHVSNIEIVRIDHIFLCHR